MGTKLFIGVRMFKTLVLIFSLCVSSALWAKGEPMMNEVIQNYFEGYQNADVELIKKAFHSETRLLSVDEGKLDVTEMSDWLKNLADRRARADFRKGTLKIISTDTKEYAATVKLKITFPTMEFTDYLSLLKINGKWIIVGKIYHYQPKE